MIKNSAYLLEKKNFIKNRSIYDKGNIKVNNRHNYVFVFFIYRETVIYYNANL